MNPFEKRISRLEALLAREKEKNLNASRCYKLGYTMFRLAQLYKLTGSFDKSKQFLNEAQSVLQSPECKRSKKVERLYSAISYFLGNPNAPPMVEMPAWIKYLSPIILVIGYAVSYIAYFSRLISYEAFFIMIIVVFVLSIAVSSIGSMAYMKRMSRNIAQYRQGSNSEYEISSSKTSDDIIDDAKAELSLANMFYSVKDIKETELHVERARMYLNDPRANQSTKKEELLNALIRLESAIKERRLYQG
ncbi:MAG: hypothetical protein QXN66_03345 [Thermoplasmatales archaeon]